MKFPLRARQFALSLSLAASNHTPPRNVCLIMIVKPTDKRTWRKRKSRLEMRQDLPIISQPSPAVSRISYTFCLTAHTRRTKFIFTSSNRARFSMIRFNGSSQPFIVTINKRRIIFSPFRQIYQADKLYRYKELFLTYNFNLWFINFLNHNLRRLFLLTIFLTSIYLIPFGINIFFECLIF